MSLEKQLGIVNSWLIKQEPTPETLLQLAEKWEEAGIKADLDSFLEKFEANCVSRCQKITKHHRGYYERYGWYNTRRRWVESCKTIIGEPKQFRWAYFLKERKDLIVAAEFLSEFLDFINQNYSERSKDTRHLSELVKTVREVYQKAIPESLAQEEPLEIEFSFLRHFAGYRYAAEPSLSKELFSEDVSDREGAYREFSRLIIPLISKRKDNPKFQEPFRQVCSTLTQGYFNDLLSNREVSDLLEKYVEDLFKERIFAEIQVKLREQYADLTYIYEQAAEKCKKEGRVDLETRLLLEAIGHQKKYWKKRFLAKKAFPRFCRLEDVDAAAKAYEAAFGLGEGFGGYGWVDEKEIKERKEVLGGLKDECFRKKLFEKLLEGLNLEKPDGSLSIADSLSRDFGYAIPADTQKKIITKVLGNYYLTGKVRGQLEEHLSALEDKDKEELRLIVQDKCRSLAEEERALDTDERRFKIDLYRSLNEHSKLARKVGAELPEEFCYSLFNVAEVSDSYSGSGDFPQKAIDEIKEVLGYVKKRNYSDLALIEQKGFSAIERLKALVT